MKQLNIIVFLLIACSLFSIHIMGEQASEPQTDKGKENLIISDEHLDFSTHKVTFIELGADQCIPCKAMQPVMREIADEYKGTIQVVFYDVWKKPEPAKKYGIRLIPTQVFINKDGNEIFRHVGFFSKKDIIAMLEEKGIL
jgi:thioredoxin 1